MESLAERRWPGTLPETLVCRTINLERLSRVISGRQQAINQCGPTQRDAPAIFITSGPAELADFLSPADLVDKYPKFYWDKSVRISIPLSATSMLPRVGAGGLQASTATYFVPTVNFAFQGQRRSSLDQARAS